MTRYEVGFMKKCAEHGVDGRAVLAKLAQDAAQAKPAGNGAPGKPGVVAKTKKVVQKGLDSASAGLSKAKDAIKTQVTAAGNWSKANPAGAGAIGAGAAGALALLLHEAFRKRKGPNDRKDYLKKILVGLAAGSGVGALAGHYHKQIANAGTATGNYFRTLGKAIAGKK